MVEAIKENLQSSIDNAVVDAHHIDRWYWDKQAPACPDFRQLWRESEDTLHITALGV